jgi:hypothetical protein
VVVVQCLSVRMVWLMVLVSVCVTVDGWPLVFAGLVWRGSVSGCGRAQGPRLSQQAQPAGCTSTEYGQPYAQYCTSRAVPLARPVFGSMSAHMGLAY